MTRVLIRKLLRDMRLPLLVVSLLLGAFQCLWARITDRIIGQLAPFFNTLAGLRGLTEKDIQAVIFEGPGKIVRTLIGGDMINMNGAMDMMTIGYVHPLMQTIFCIWAVGRASGAIAGETDRGTAELLLAQPMPRSRLILAHLVVDLLTIPVLCLSLWTGTLLGTYFNGEIKLRPLDLKSKQPQPTFQVDILGYKLIEFKVLTDDGQLPESMRESGEATRRRLEVRPWEFWKALPAVAGLLFAISGYTMWLSSMGRFRWRVLGSAVLLTLLMFLINLIGQMWDLLEPLRPFTIFFYYQPQQMILDKPWNPMHLFAMYAVGAVGYALAWWTLKHRDIPAPL